MISTKSEQGNGRMRQWESNSSRRTAYGRKLPLDRCATLAFRWPPRRRRGITCDNRLQFWRRPILVCVPGGRLWPARSQTLSSRRAICLPPLPSIGVPDADENVFDRGLLKAQRIRMKLGGSANITLPFPPKPKFMRWNTYYRLMNADNDGLTRSIAGLRVWLASHNRS